MENSVDATEVLRAARRAGIRIGYDLKTGKATLKRDSLTKANEPELEALKDCRDSVNLRLRWEANEADIGQRPCPDCGGIDWVNAMRPRLTVRPGGGSLMASEKPCNVCEYGFRWQHGTWSYCAYCGDATGDFPEKIARYVCGTCNTPGDGVLLDKSAPLSHDERLRKDALIVKEAELKQTVMDLFGAKEQR